MSTEKIVTQQVLVKPVPGYEGLYEVSSDGRVWSLNYHRQGIRKELKGKLDKNGYHEVGLRKDGKKISYRAHRLIALTFIPNPDNMPQVNHKDAIKTNNSIDNLEWCTCLENIQHSWDMGLRKFTRRNTIARVRKPRVVREANMIGRYQKGEYNNATKLTNDTVTQIWNLKGKEKQRIIAERFNTSEDVVGMIHRQVNWRHVTDKLKTGKEVS